MDKVHCNIIQDLLPLYVDDVVSPESREMVEKHLTGCLDCRQVLDEVRSSVPIPQHTDTCVMKKMRRKERLALLMPVLALIVLLYFVIGEPILARYIDSRIDYGPEDCAVTTNADGRPIIQMSERAKGANIYYLYDMTEEGLVDVYICIAGNPGRFAPVHEWLGHLLKWEFSEDGIYVTPTLGLNPPHAQHSSYPDTLELHFDETVSAVYYQSISYEETSEFLNQYLWKTGVPGEEHLLEYEVPESSERVLLWSKTR